MKHKLGLGGMAAAVAMFALVQVGQAQVDMTLVNAGSESVTDVGMVDSSLGINIPVNDAYIGLYQFQVNGGNSSTLSQAGLSSGQMFYSVCLSPSGILDWTQHSYDYDTFSQAANGLNPSNPNWTTGVQNATYLWRLFNSSVTSGSQGAGLAMAMYEALYDSSGLGTLNYQKTFQPIFGSDAAAQAAYNYYINYLETFGPTAYQEGVAANEQSGYVLVPDPSNINGSGQEFIIVAPGTPNLQPVPEPATIIAVALLLLPVGASTLRIIRKKKMIN